MVSQTAQARAKIKPLEELAQVLESQRFQKKIVHCHGVFDLLHVGHVRHFNQARQLGDILVVTVTPDRYVNKGPHRPVFGEAFRAEMVAALESVDYVAINHWPTAVETIRLLKPDFYVKGADYQKDGQDLTGAIHKEKEAVESAGGKMHFTQGVTFSSSSLVNQVLPVFSEEVKSYLFEFSRRYSSTDVLSHLEKARVLKALVVGEAIVDEYHYCEAIGKSSKEPTLAVKGLSQERFAGGSLAIANHLADFSGNVELVTFLGSRDSQREFIQEKLDRRIHPYFLTRQDSPTIVKRRFIESYFFSKLFEVYQLNDAELAPIDNEALCRLLREKVSDFDLVIVADFGHGMLSQEAIGILCERSKFLALNVQANAGNLGYHTVSTYPRADYLCMAEGEARLEARDRRGDLRKVVESVSKRLSCDRILVTRGRNGNLAYGRSEGFFETPALATQVVDRTGAGDAVFSVTALCAALKAPMNLVGFVGNAVGAQAVAMVGNRHPIGRIPLFKTIESFLK